MFQVFVKLKLLEPDQGEVLAVTLHIARVWFGSVRFLLVIVLVYGAMFKKLLCLCFQFFVRSVFSHFVIFGSMVTPEMF